MTRKMINVEVDVYIDFDYTPVRNTIKELTQVVEKYEALGFTNLHFRSKNTCGCYHSCNCAPRLVVFGEREETDTEYIKRVKDETVRQMQQDARDRELYQRLKNQFEG